MVTKKIPLFLLGVFLAVFISVGVAQAEDLWDETPIVMDKAILIDKVQEEIISPPTKTIPEDWQIENSLSTEKYQVYKDQAGHSIFSVDGSKDFYRDENGNIRETNNNFEDPWFSDYKVETNSLKVYFSKTIGSWWWQTDKVFNGNYYGETFRLNAKGIKDGNNLIEIQSSDGIILGNTITYPNVFADGIDLKYTYEKGKKLKEEIIINDYSNVPNRLNDSLLEFVFTFETNKNISVKEVQQDKSVINKQWDKTNINSQEIKLGALQIPRGEIVDANGKKKRIDYQMYNSNGLNFLIVKVAKENLVDATYPLTIDPSLTVSTTDVVLGGNLTYDICSITNNANITINTTIKYLFLNCTTSFTRTNGSYILGYGQGAEIYASGGQTNGASGSNGLYGTTGGAGGTYNDFGANALSGGSGGGGGASSNTGGASGGVTGGAGSASGGSANSNQFNNNTFYGTGGGAGGGDACGVNTGGASGAGFKVMSPIINDAGINLLYGQVGTSNTNCGGGQAGGGGGGAGHLVYIGSICNISGLRNDQYGGNGGSANSGSTYAQGGGGGGAGGNFLVYCNITYNTSMSINQAGGSGGSGDNGNFGGTGNAGTAGTSGATYYFGMPSFGMISYVNPTPASNTYQSSTSIYINTTSASVANNSAYTDINRSIVLHLEMNVNSSTNFTDSSSYSNNGSIGKGWSALLGGSNLTPDFTNNGRYGGGYTFNGSQYITVLNNPSFNLTNFTVSVWYKLTTVGSSPRLVSKEVIGQPSWGLIIVADVPYFFINDDNACNLVTTGGVTTNDGAWHNLVGTRGTKGQVTIYQDGIRRVNQTTTCTGSISNGGNVSIGFSNTIFFNGTMDNVLISNREWTSAEVNASFDNFRFRLEHNVTGLPQGNISTTSYLLDNSGGRYSTETRYITLDTINPTINFTYPTPYNNSGYKQNNLEVNISITDANFGNATVYLINGTGSIINITTYYNNNIYTNFINLINGTYYYNVSARDLAGNQIKSETRQFNVDTINPLINFDSTSTPAGLYLSLNSIYINYTTSDNSNQFYVVNDNNRKLRLRYSFENLTGDNGTIYGDDSSYSNNMTCNSISSCPQIIKDGRYGQGLYLNGSESLQKIITNATDGNDQFSMTYWAKPISAQAGVIFQLDQSLGVNAIYSDISGSNIRLITYNNSGQFKVYYSVAPTGFNASNWAYYGVVVNSTDICFAIRENGNLDTCVSRQVGINFNLSNRLNIGSNGASFFFNGTLDEINYYGKALTPSELNSTWRGEINPYSFNYTNLSDGTYTYQGLIIDIAGNKNKTEIKTIIKDSSAPTVNFTGNTALNNSFVQQNYIIANTTSTFVTFLSINYSLYNSTSLVNKTGYATQINFTNWTNLPNGNYTYNVTLYAQSGFYSETETRKIVLDTVKPNIDFQPPTETNGTAPLRRNINVNVSDGDLNAKNITIYFSNSTALLYVNTSNVTISYWINYTNLPDDYYFFNASACDYANNCNYTNTRTILITVSTPTLNLAYPTNNQLFLFNTTLSLNYSSSGLGGTFCWYNLDNGPNISLTNCGNSTFNVSNNNHRLNLYNNNSAGGQNYQTINFSVINVTFGLLYNTPVYTTSYQYYYGTILGNASFSDGFNVSATFTYNGFTLPTTVATDGINRIQFTAQQQTPTITIPTSYNLNFNYNATYKTSSNMSTSLIGSQLVNPFLISLCSAANASQVITANYSIKSEPNDTYMFDSMNLIQGNFQFWIDNSSATINFTFINNQTNQTKICIPPNLQLQANAFLEYSRPSYDVRFYFHNNATFNNITQEIPLYLLEITSGTQAIFNVQNLYGVGIPNAYVHVLRYYPGTNQYKLVSMVKTDADGIGNTYLRFNDVFYKFLVYDENNELLYTSEQTQLTLTQGYSYGLVYLRVGSTPLGTTLQEYANVAVSSLTYSNSTGYCSVTYSTPTGNTIDEFCIEGMLIKNANTTFGRNCGTTSSGTLSVYIGNTSNNLYSCRLLVSKDSNEESILQIYIDQRYSIAKTLGTDGPFIALLLLIVFVTIALFNPTIAIVMAVLSLIISAMLGLIWIPLSALVGIILVGVFLIVKNKN